MNVYIENYIDRKWKIVIGPLLSHIRVVNDEFDGFLSNRESK